MRPARHTCAHLCRAVWAGGCPGLPGVAGGCRGWKDIDRRRLGWCTPCARHGTRRATLRHAITSAGTQTGRRATSSSSSGSSGSCSRRHNQPIVSGRLQAPGVPADDTPPRPLPARDRTDRTSSTSTSTLHAAGLPVCHKSNLGRSVVHTERSLCFGPGRAGQDRAGQSRVVQSRVG